MEAQVFGNLKASDDRLSFAHSGFGARRGLQNVFGSFLVGEALDDQERNEECENEDDCH